MTERLALYPPVYCQSPALRNFFLTAASLGPAGWMMAQGLDWLNNKLDNGSQTCGLDFIYEAGNIEVNAEAEDRNRILREDILSVLGMKEVSYFKDKVVFMSETGR